MTPADLLKLQRAAKAGKKITSGLSAVKEAEAIANMSRAGEMPLTAADRARVGKLAAEYTANQPVTRMSEALGNVGAEGKKLRVTQTARTGAKYLGGAPFSMMQKVDPRYAEAMATWGVKTPGAAKNIANQAGDDILWSTLIGSPTQHRSNELIFDKLYKEFQKSAKQGNLDQELRAKFNAALKPLFGEGADILDPKLRKEIDTFEKRAMVGNLLLGEGLGGALRGGSIIPSGKIMAETTEPMLRDVDTFSIGPRLFTLNKGVVTRPDLHPAFPEILQGEDKGQLFIPAPNEIALPTFNEEFKARTGRKKPGYYDLTMTPPGQPYPTQDVTEKYLTHLQKEGYAKGGLAHMAAGGTPSQQFPLQPIATRKPISSLIPLTEAAAAVQEAYKAEQGTYGAPGAGMDILNRGIVSDILGGAVDVANLPLQGIDWLQSKIPALSKPASVMDLEGERVAAVPISTDEPFAGKEAWNKLFQKSGITSKTERPVAETATSLLAPFAPAAAGKAARLAVKGAKAAAPTAARLVEEYAQKTPLGIELQMSVMPEDDAAKAAYKEAMRLKYAEQNKPKAVVKTDEVKAPANELGFYSAAEKAALNLQRKTGSGDAFIADLLKQPDVSPSRLDEMGITDALKGRTGVTRDEVQRLVSESKIPLEESVKGNTVDPEDVLRLERNNSFLKWGIEDANKGLQEEKARGSATGIAQKEEKILRLIEALKDGEKRLSEMKPAKFGPESHPDYNMPGGENYREIRMKLPTKPFGQEEAAQNYYNTFIRKGGEQEWEQLPKQKQQEIISSMPSTAKNASDAFYHSAHHGDEPNVLLHMRVADHVDAEGKKGLLIDELQSDWHQQGREKGYGKSIEFKPTTYKPEDFDISQTENQWVTKDARGVQRVVGKGTVSDEQGAREYFARWLTNLDKEYATELAQKNYGRVPEAPFKENWYQLGLKRAIKEATDNGMDRVYLTTGKTQANRYDLSKQVDQLLYDKNPDGTYTISAITGSRGNMLGEAIPENKLAEYVGKEIAEKIVKGEGAKTQVQGSRPYMNALSGGDLKVGGEGMKQYYDKTYLDWLKKYARQHGATVGETTLPFTAKKRGDLSGKEMHNLLDKPEFKKELDRILNEEFLKNPNRPTAEISSEAWNKALESISSEKVYYLDLSPNIKKSAVKGQAYAKGGAVSGDDLEARMNKMLAAHHYAKGGAVSNLEDRMNAMLAAHYAPQKMAEGGSPYNSTPDMADGGAFIQAGPFKIGGRISLIKH